jgi:hypothetical protein
MARYRVPCRRFGVGQGLLDALVAQKRLPDAFPDGVLDHRIIGMLGRYEGRLLCLGEQFLPPLCQRTRLCRGAGVLAGVGPRGEGAQLRLEPLGLPRG